MAADTVFVGNLDPRVDVSILYELFCQAGPIKLITRHPDRAYAFIQFDSEASAEYAVELLGGLPLQLFGRSVSVNWSEGSRQARAAGAAPLQVPPAVAPQHHMRERDGRAFVAPQVNGLGPCACWSSPHLLRLYVQAHAYAAPSYPEGGHSHPWEGGMLQVRHPGFLGHQQPQQPYY